jgi:hypothetical protein
MKTPGFYPHHPAAVELIQTHISHVFIAGDFVYKVKKPLCFDFLDFTTLEKRKFFCEEEVKLNKRLAPETYLDVVAISLDSQGNPTLQNGVEIIDYAVRMKKLPQERMLKTLLSQGLADEDIMDKVAEKVAGFHQDAQYGRHIDVRGGIENIRHNNEENFSETVAYIHVTIPEYQYRLIADYVKQFLAAHKTLFEKRIADHKIRDCHGDLHLEHICITDDIIIFDCIEFNERFRYADVAQDVAFLTMDIDFNGYSPHAQTFIQSYVKYSGDTDMPLLLNFYRCYCAYVRGKVTSFRLREKDLSPKMRDDITKTARQYFDLSYTYATRLEKPALILTAGLMGSGKSYQARQLARRWNAEIICSDVLRKELFDLKPSDRRYDDFGKGIYSDGISTLVYDKALELAAEKIKQGQPVIIDASFKKREERLKAIRLAVALGIDFYVLECVCSDDVTRKRLERRKQDNDNPSDGRWELFQQQKDDFEAINEVPANRLFKIDTSADPETARQEIIRKIRLGEYA